MAEKQRGRKIGRNKLWCKSYTARDREMTNRKRRIRRTLKDQPNNDQLVRRYVKEFGPVPPTDQMSSRAARKRRRQMRLAA